MTDSTKATRRSLLFVVLATLSLAGCVEKREFALPSDIAPLFGGSNSAPAQQTAPGSQLPATGASKMLQDPEAQPNEWDEPILAADPQEAERICRQRAAKYRVEFRRVQPPSRVRPGQNQQYRCWFQPQ